MREGAMLYTGRPAGEGIEKLSRKGGEKQEDK